jgi:thiol-disulfide isomerase/thioredoxin
MHSTFYLLLLLCIVTAITHAQDPPSPLLNIGDPAPPLRVREWIKGTPVQQFEKGKVYVVEFWATWCKPCIAAMPHLSALARQYMDKITILGINVYEWKIPSSKSIKKVKAFVDSMGNRMDFHVAAEDTNFTVADWLEASGEKVNGIPRTFVVNAEGRLAWMGHPKNLDAVLSKVVDNTWDINKALAKRNENKRLYDLDTAADYIVYPYIVDPKKRRDSALLVIDELVRKEPKLKYAPRIASYTFHLLLETDPNKAYEYGKAVLVTPTYADPDPVMIIGAIKWYSDKLNFPAEIYELGAEAYQADIDQIPYPELVNISERYNNMAEWYWRAKNKVKAVEAQQKAIEALKSKTDYSMVDMAALKSRLQQYKNM